MDGKLIYCRTTAELVARTTAGPAMVIVTDRAPDGLDYLVAHHDCRPLDLERAGFAMLAQAAEASHDMAAEGCEISLARMARIAAVLQQLQATVQPISARAVVN